MANQSSMAKSHSFNIQPHDARSLLLQQFLVSMAEFDQHPKGHKDFNLHYTRLMTLAKSITEYCIQQDNNPQPIPLSGYGHKVVCYFYQSSQNTSKQDAIPLNLGVFATYTNAIEALQPHKANPFYAGYFISEEGNHE